MGTFSLLNFYARGGTAHPFANPAALQAAESLTPQAPERLLYATNIFSKPARSLAVIFRGIAIPILLQGVKPRPAAHAPVADVLSAP